VSGAMLLQDAASGRPLALLDSQVITVLRTAAATAVAVRHLARPGSRRALLVGAGRQAPAQVEALATVLRLEQLAVWDVQPASAERLAGHASSLGVPAHVPPSAAAGAQDSDVIVTVTPALAPVLRADEVPPGALVVAIGADGPGKQEHEPALLARSKVVVDVLEQAATSGELAHALAAGLMAPEDVYAELGEIVAGAKPGRTSDGETIVFDATGTALQDVAAALVIVEAARARGVGLEVARRMTEARPVGGCEPSYARIRTGSFVRRPSRLRPPEPSKLALARARPRAASERATRTPPRRSGRSRGRRRSCRFRRCRRG